MDLKKAVIAGVTGTVVKTLCSYFFSFIEKEQVTEPELLGTLLTGQTKKNGEVSKTPVALATGYGTHFLTGIGFASCYEALWSKNAGRPDLKNALIFGAVNGLIGLGIWRIVLGLHPRPPKVPFSTFNRNMMINHLFFGLTATAVHRLLSSSTSKENYNAIPRDPKIDSTFALLRLGYPYLFERTKQNHSDIFQTRFIGKKAICIHGQEAAEIFYDAEKFERKNALPKRIQKTLMGKDGVQMLDDAPHHHRKAMFMSLMTPESIQHLMDIMAEEWQHAVGQWKSMDQVVIFTASREIICQAVCRWAGVPLQEEEVAERAKDLGDMVDAFGAVGPRHWKGKKARQKSEKWIEEIIEQVRSGQRKAEEGKALHTIAFYKDLEGNLLSTRVAAVELLNVLRPVTAINTYISFLALALHEHPECRKKLIEENENYALYFVQEVRRFYPFTPLLGAYVRKDFEWKGYHFPQGTMVLLDVYGTLHDTRLWDAPDTFKPERFENWEGSPFDFIPQGGGDHYTGHRCAGEWLTIDAMKLALKFLVHDIQYEVPPQDLNYDLSRMPTLPTSGFIISNVEEKQPTPEVKQVM